MTYTVAEAEVRVLPNAENFGETLRAQVLASADRIGKEAGDEIVKGIRERVRAGLADMPDAKVDVDTTKASRKVDTFLAETKAKAKVAGVAAGKDLGDGMSQGFQARSALIGTAIGAGLIAGGPLVVAAAGVLFGGVAAVILHNQENVAKAAADLGHTVGDAYSQVAQVAVPYLVGALQTVKSAALELAPQVGELFDHLQPAIDGVVNGVIRFTSGVLPGLNAAIANSKPVFAGLADLLGKIGSGLGNVFEQVSTHGSAMGTVLSSLGGLLQALFRILGTVVSAGAELGKMVLPPLVSVLSALASVLEFLGPILPEIALGFAAWKIADVLAPMLGKLAVNLEEMGAKAMVAVAGMSGMEAAGLAAGTGFEAAASGARGLQAAMGPIGLVLAGISLLIPALVSKFGSQDDSQKQVAASAEKMRQALEASKGAITDNVRATAAMEAQKDGILAMASNWGVSSATIVDALTGNAQAMSVVQNGAQAYIDSMTASANADEKKNGALALSTIGYRAAAGAGQDALDSFNQLSGATAEEAANQAELQAAINGTADATQVNASRLQGLANTASAASSAINLLKGALDALTGKTVSLGDAEVAVTNAAVAASTALDGQKDKNGNLTSSLTDATGALDKHTAAGAAAWSALTNMAGADNQLIATMEQQGATADEVTKRDGELRDSFVKTAEGMGFSAGEAENLANQIYGIPSDRKTEITADTAQATQAVADLQARLAAIHDKSVKITTYLSTVSAPGTSGAAATVNSSLRQIEALGGAIGGIVQPMASGGVNLSPMSGGIAQIVGPQTYRVIGDRATNDEAFIPINGSARSLEILSQTARRMGFELAASGRGSGKTDARSYSFQITAAADPQAIAREVREAQRDLEFLHG